MEPQRWCGLGVCVLGEEPKPGRNETVWVHMRNCLHKCNRTQVRPATNEEAEGIETVTSLLPNLTEAVREGRTRHFADITEEGDPEDDEPTVVEGDVMDVRLGRPDSQPEPELSASANSDASSPSDRSETYAEPEAEVSTSVATDMEIGVGDRRVRFREERESEIPRDIIWTHPRTGSRWEKNAKTSRDEPRQVTPLFLFIPPKQARPSSHRCATAASDNPTGERLYMSMTEEGPLGDYRMTMQRDRHGRWMPTKGERTMNIQKAREEGRSFHVGESKEHGTFSVASAEVGPLRGEFNLSRGHADEVSWNLLSAEEQNAFFESNRNRMARIT